MCIPVAFLLGGILWAAAVAGADSVRHFALPFFKQFLVSVGQFVCRKMKKKISLVVGLF